MGAPPAVAFLTQARAALSGELAVGARQHPLYADAGIPAYLLLELEVPNLTWFAPSASGAYVYEVYEQRGTETDDGHDGALLGGQPGRRARTAVAALCAWTWPAVVRTVRRAGW